ncbi:tRNA (guanosine(37)-N1)-methyltransferase TrmD [Helicobacter muridarum]|uniref:tRNA (guanine-N(1)-)-methyltransferase n=1 Tax=Helicobacter muridarum TaxID=216 RepID=A0A099TYH3_9HELI|nr:tRNA (guanosine(37)-N1)-methyltransferase TrmD [Helicobacter muridarum]TLD99831.1 tRNA (guanosine(37)-N1)-methyltransferase TrmD [Helicobacter muridarum]STQ86960.1 tRNA-(guanine-N1)-methyltransferase [Helicobacter muridarum]
MRLSFLSLFPNVIESYLNSSIIGRAKQANIISIDYINIRDFSTNAYKKVDKALIGGGAGMLLEPYVLDLALKGLKDSRIIFLSPCGAKFSYKDSKRLSKYSHISFVCGRYEGFDERIIELYATEIFSIGDFILTGGELGALCIADSIIRHKEGVLGNAKSLEEESFEANLLESPNFTKSREFDRKYNIKPPSEFSNGNHAVIKKIKHNMATMKTLYFRPDLLK